MNPLTDAVFTVSRILFQHFPIPPTIDDIKRADLGGPNLLEDAMEIDKKDAAALQQLALKCSSKEELSARVQYEASLSGLLPRIADDDDASQRRVDEACAVLDALIRPLEDGLGLRQAVSRPPPPGWSQLQTAIHALCSAALMAGCDLVAKCSDLMHVRDRKAEIDAGKQAELDQHSMNALIPLLGFALDSLRYPQLSRWHKRLAWHTVTQLARTLSVVLKRPSHAVAATTLPAPQTVGGLLLVKGHPVLLPPHEARLEGDESRAQLALTGASGSATTVWKTVWGIQTAELDYDAISHAVLPRTGVSNADEPPVGAAAAVRQLVEQVEEEREALQQLDELAKKGREMSLPAQGQEACFGKELVAVAQQIMAAQLHGSLLLPALEEARREIKRIEEQAARLTQGGKVALTHPFALADTPTTLLHGVEAWLGAHPLLAQCDHTYAQGQHLSVNTSSGWQDMQVIKAAGASHRVTPVDAKGEDSTPLDLILHPWNHAPLQLPSMDCEASLARHMRLLKARNASMTDALSGERLDIFEQSVPIEVQGEALELKDVKGLASKVLRAYDQRLGGDASSRACFVLVAEAATGKTVLMSQVRRCSLLCSASFSIGP